MAESCKNTDFDGQSPTKSSSNMQGSISPDVLKIQEVWFARKLKQVFSSQGNAIGILGFCTRQAETAGTQSESVYSTACLVKGMNVECAPINL